MSEEFPKGGCNQPSYFRILNLHDLARTKRNTSKFKRSGALDSIFLKKVVWELLNYGRPVRISPSLHDRKSTPTPKVLGKVRTLREGQKI